MSEKETKKKKGKTPFPKKTLLDALRIAQAIQDHNAGEPYDRLDLSTALGYSPSTGSFRMLITSSGQFGLTKGGYTANQISLTERGRSIVAPRDEVEKNRGLLEALLSIEIFRTFFKKFDNKKMPKPEFVQNTLARDFGIPTAQVKACYAMILANAKGLGILDDLKGSAYVRLSKLGVKRPAVREGIEVEEDKSGVVDEESPEPDVISEPPTPPEPMV